MKTFDLQGSYLKSNITLSLSVQVNDGTFYSLIQNQISCDYIESSYKDLAQPGRRSLSYIETRETKYNDDDSDEEVVDRVDPLRMSIVKKKIIS